MRPRAGRGPRTFQRIALITALMVAVPATALPAQAKAPAPALRLQATAASFKVGTAVSLTGSVTPGSRATVLVQRLSGKSWTVLGHAKPTSRGTFSVSFKAPRTPTTWTVRAVRAKSGKVPALTSKAVKVHAVKSAYAVTATGVSVTVGAPVVVTGKVSPKAKGSVVLQLRSGSRWVTLAKAGLSRTSTYRLTAVRPVGSYGLRVLKAATTSVAQGVSKTITLKVVRPPLMIATTSLPYGDAGIPYSATLSATGGLPPYTWSATGLPAGITVNNAGLITGTSVVPAHAAVTITVVDATGMATSEALNLLVELPAAATQQLWAWGDGTAGQLGSGDTPLEVSVPRAVGLTGVTAVTGALGTTFALRYDGSVWAWGSDTSGKLGDGGLHPGGVLRPLRVQGLGRTVALAAGDASAYALGADGTVWAWGSNVNGQLGDGTKTNRSVPQQVPGLSRIVGVGAGSASAYAVDQDGVVWSWGYNFDGELGDGTSTDRAVPQRVSGLGRAVAVASGPQTVAALLADGTVWMWGRNDGYQLGNGTTTTSHRPVQVPGLTGVVSVALNRLDTYALTASGATWAWGSGTSGGIGRGSTADAPTPVTVLLPPATSITAGPDAAIARLADGTVATWGANGVGQLGNGTTTQSLSPGTVPDLTGVVSVGSGALNAYAITSS